MKKIILCAVLALGSLGAISYANAQEPCNDPTPCTNQAPCNNPEPCTNQEPCANPAPCDSVPCNPAPCNPGC